LSVIQNSQEEAQQPAKAAARKRKAEIDAAIDHGNAKPVGVRQ
jgi:hypothetical protein